MNLVIDIGNSLQKIALFDHEPEPLFVHTFKNISYNDISPLLDKFPIKNSIISAVAPYEQKITDILKLRTHFITFTQNLDFSIRIQYEDKQTLGSDRLANAVAAHSLYPNQSVLSIQAGSCIVADFIDKNGNYCGGSISPGIDMRFRALYEFTSQLPRLSKKNIDFFIGNSTENSILSGVINGTINEINVMIERYKNQYSDLLVLLTGGDGEFLNDALKNRLFFTPHLVLIGLNKILDINL